MTVWQRRGNAFFNKPERFGGCLIQGRGWKVLLDSGAMTTDQIAALSPDIIVNHVTDLAQTWKLPARPDIALEDEISRILQRH